eukprot:tig00001126_g7126.t1
MAEEREAKRARVESSSATSDALNVDTSDERLQLIDLPDELLLRVFSSCSANASRCALARTCKRLHQLSNLPEAGWRYLPLRVSVGCSAEDASTAKAESVLGERFEGRFMSGTEAIEFASERRFGRVTTLRFVFARRRPRSTSVQDCEEELAVLDRVLAGASFAGVVTDLYLYVYKPVLCEDDAGEGGGAGGQGFSAMREVEPGADEAEVIARRLPSLRSVFCTEGGLRTFTGLALGGLRGLEQLLTARHLRSWHLLLALFPRLHRLSNCERGPPPPRRPRRGAARARRGAPPLLRTGRSLRPRPDLAARATTAAAAAAAADRGAARPPLEVAGLTLVGLDLRLPGALDALVPLLARGARFVTLKGASGVAALLRALAALPPSRPFLAAAAACPSDSPAPALAGLASLGGRVESLRVEGRPPSSAAPPAAALLEAAAALAALRHLELASCPGAVPLEATRRLLAACPLLASLSLARCPPLPAAPAGLPLRGRQVRRAGGRRAGGPRGAPGGGGARWAPLRLRGAPEAPEAEGGPGACPAL